MGLIGIAYCFYKITCNHTFRGAPASLNLRCFSSISIALLCLELYHLIFKMYRKKRLCRLFHYERNCFPAWYFCYVQITSILQVQSKSSSKRFVQNSVTGFRIKALFWGQRKASETAKSELSLGDFSLIELEPEGQATNIDKDKKVTVSVVSSISEISSDDWDACSIDASGPKNFNPFLSHGFLSALEETGCAVKETGWVPQHIIARDDSNNILGVIPLYLKSHSYGEYVFDHSWADAYYSYGSRYYPKLQCCVPFTPVTGPRILVRNTMFRDQVFDNLVSALLELTVKFQVSSLHITFPSSSDCGKLKERGFLQRIGMQYHWKNRNYRSFDDFLMDLKQSKRKNIRQERKKISAQNLSMKRLRGYEIKAKHWDTFYKFYRNTTDNKLVFSAIFA